MRVPPFLSGNGIIGLGTERRPKILATQKALRTIAVSRAGHTAEHSRIEARSVPSGTESTPRTTRSMMVGARNRAQAVLATLKQEGLEVDLAIGLEGGVWRPAGVDSGAGLLESWAFVSDGTSGHFGSSGSVPLPYRIAQRVFENGEELGAAADSEFSTRDIAGGAGTFGVLTANLVTREEAFVRALLHALAPFYNGGVYGDAPG